MTFPLRKGPSGPPVDIETDITIQVNGADQGEADTLNFQGAGVAVGPIVDGVAPITIPGGGGGGNGLTADNKALTPLATAGNAQSTGIALVQSPTGGSYARTQVNGLAVSTATQQAERLARDCFWSFDGGGTVATMGPAGTIAAGAILYWNGLVAGYELDASDEVEVDFVNA